MKNKKCKKYFKRTMAVLSMVILTLLVGVYGTSVNERLGASVVNSVDYDAGTNWIAQFNISVGDNYLPGQKITINETYNTEIFSGSGEDVLNCFDAKKYIGDVSSITGEDLIAFYLSQNCDDATITNPSTGDIKFTGEAVACTPEITTIPDGLVTVGILQNGEGSTNEEWTATSDGVGKYLYTIGDTSGTCYDYPGDSDNFTADCITILDAAFPAEYTFVDNGTNFTVSLSDGAFTLGEVVSDFDPMTISFTVTPTDPVENGTTANFTITTGNGDHLQADLADRWFIDDVLQAGETGTTFNWTPDTAGSFVIKAERYNTHDDSYSATVEITRAVEDSPVANFTTVKTYLEVAFTNTSTGTDPKSYRWDFDNNSTWDSTDVNPIHTYPSAGTYTVKLEVSDNNSWEDTKTSTVTVTEAPEEPEDPPTVSFITTPLTDPIEGGTTVIFMASGTAEGYKWYDNDILQVGESGATFNWDTTGLDAGLHTITVRNYNVNNEALFAEASYPGTVKYALTPGLNVSASDLLVIVTDASIKGTDDLTTWAYDLTDDGEYDIFTQNFKYTYPAKGTYTMRQKVGDGNWDKETTVTFTLSKSGGMNYAIYNDLYIDHIDDKVCVSRRIEGANYYYNVDIDESCPYGASELAKVGIFGDDGKLYESEGKDVIATVESGKVSAVYVFIDGRWIKTEEGKGNLWTATLPIVVAEHASAEREGLGTAHVYCVGVMTEDVIYDDIMSVEEVKIERGVLSVGSEGEKGGGVSFSVIDSEGEKGGGVSFSVIDSEGEKGGGVSFAFSATNPNSLIINCDVYSPNLEFPLSTTRTLPFGTSPATLSAVNFSISGTIDSQPVEFINASSQNIKGTVRKSDFHSSANTEQDQNIKNEDQNQTIEDGELNLSSRTTEHNSFSFGNLFGGRLSGKFSDFVDFVKGRFGGEK